MTPQRHLIALAMPLHTEKLMPEAIYRSECPFACLSRSGSVCTRYVRANLPLLDLSSKAGLDSVLGIGIALIVLALLLMCIMAIILIRMRRKATRKRGKKGWGLFFACC